MTALDGGATGAFFRALGPAVRRLGPPQAIAVLSAHTLARSFTLWSAAQHSAVYDFGGFDPRLRTLRHDVPGAPHWVDAVSRALEDAGFGVDVAPLSGLDHGMWTPLRHALPEADIPVLPLAWNPRLSPAELWRAGQALAPLSGQGLWLVASGSITHNLQLFMTRQPPVDAPEFPESLAFRQWWQSRSLAGDWPALWDYRRQAPHAVAMHPTDEHLLPWFVAAGAGGEAHPGLRLHEGVQHGLIGMDAYAFGPHAPALAAGLAAA